MDPDANLAEQCRLADEIREAFDSEEPNFIAIAHKADRLAHLVTALDQWIRGGGFLPKAWQR